jgi:hypothetical protein
MTLERLVRTAGRFERDLLHAARSEAPPHGAEDRAVAALAALAGGASAVDAPREPGGATVSSPALGAGALKAIAALSALVTVGVIVVLVLVRARSVPAAAPVGAPDRITAAVSASAASAESARAAALVTGSPVLGPVDQGAADAPSAHAAASSTPPSSTAPSSAAAPPRVPAGVAQHPSVDGRCTLSREREMLGEALHHLAGNAGAALRIIDEYRRTCPRGRLDEEAEITRIEALVALGRAAEAKSAALRFRAAHPKSLYTHRIRTLLDEAEPR